MNKNTTIKLACNMILASEKMDQAGKTEEAKVLLDNSLNMIKKSNFWKILGKEIVGQLPKAHWLTPWRTVTYKGLKHLDELANRTDPGDIKNYLNTKLNLHPSQEAIDAISKSTSPQEIWNLLGAEKLLGKSVHEDFGRRFTPLSKIGLTPLPVGISHGIKQQKRRRPVFEDQKPIFEDENPQIEQKPETEYNFY